MNPTPKNNVKKGDRVTFKDPKGTATRLPGTVLAGPRGALGGTASVQPDVDSAGGPVTVHTDDLELDPTPMKFGVWQDAGAASGFVPGPDGKPLERDTLSEAESEAVTRGKGHKAKAITQALRNMKRVWPSGR